MSLETGRLFESVLPPDPAKPTFIRPKWEVIPALRGELNAEQIKKQKEIKEDNAMNLRKALRVVYVTFKGEQLQSFAVWQQLVEMILSSNMIVNLKEKGLIGAQGIGFLGSLIDASVHPLESEKDIDLYSKFKAELRSALGIIQNTQPVRDKV